MSQDPEEYTSVLRNCFRPNCVIDNDDIWLYGSSRIKKALDFTTSICSSSGMIGEPKWDKKALTITFTYYRQLKLGFRVTQVTTLHVIPIYNSNDGPTLWVTKIGDRHVNMPWTAWPIIGPLHLYVFRVLFSWMILVVATVFMRRAASKGAVRRGSS
ncbi:uncharacterized protein MKK02DRAFT_39156 [Dioszegia hungarica]|uniref:Uncharacterized protein n=1 Tax=Dioszegia hungarica TaxID=4972 RepID=A0AA38LTA4_9TREE|nr:uncharacterized protein MKK02DRAFT_39156 [Dioszegia hungarica]KAI9633179.1 hypothetical protein MKK02DRAFT_39156 [Dioszegia hungarica]